jgi:hypothetical protein
MEESVSGGRPKPLKLQVVEGDCERLIMPESDYARRDSNPQPMVPKTIALSS